jgi:hypothetical protein
MNAKEKAAIVAAIQESKKMTATEREKKKRGIKKRAERVYDISLDYHLTHAVFGTDELLMHDLKEAYKDKYGKINKGISTAAQKMNVGLVKKLEERKRALDLEVESKKHHILIRYIEMSDGYGGRVLSHDKKFIILLPNKLKENIKDENYVLKQDVVEELRKKTAHELGHIVLHARLVPEGGLRGTGYLDPLDWEAVAFANELLRLYASKNPRVNKKIAS